MVSSGARRSTPGPPVSRSPRTPLPTEADIQSFLSRDGVRAIGVARATGFDGATPQFLLALSRKLTNPAEVILLVELAKITGNPQVALRLAKIAFNRDLPVGDYALAHRGDARNSEAS